MGLSIRLRIPPGIIGATVAAFATSAPELAVGINAALAGTPQIAAGDALGSNVANAGLVMGVALLFGPIRLDIHDLKRDLPLTILSPLLVGVLLWDGLLSRFDSAVLIVVFVIWLTVTTRNALHDRSLAGDILDTPNPARALVYAVGGTLLLIAAGRLVIIAATGIGQSLGLDPFLVGGTLVAFGTSMPEFATTLLSRWRGHDEFGAGTVMGSNVFNTLWIVGIVALIRPIELTTSDVGIAVMSGTATAALLIPGPSLLLSRGRGVALLVTYGAYVGALAFSAR